MKHRFLFLCGLFLPFGVLLGWTGYLTYTSLTAPQVIVAVKGYDPLDLFSGHYIQYEIDWEKTNCRQFPEGYCPKSQFVNIPRRYYLPEQAAEKIDRLMQAQNTVSVHFDMVFSYIKGRQPIARMLLINNQKWFDYLNKNERKK